MFVPEFPETVSKCNKILDTFLTGLPVGMDDGGAVKVGGGSDPVGGKTEWGNLGRRLRGRLSKIFSKSPGGLGEAIDDLDRAGDLRGNRFDIESADGREGNAKPGMLVGEADFSDPGSEIAGPVAIGEVCFARPLIGLIEIGEGLEGDGTFAQGHFAKDLNGGEVCGRSGGVGEAGVLVEIPAGIAETVENSGVVGLMRAALGEGTFEFFEDLPLVRTVAVEFEGNRAKPDGIQTAVDDLEGGEFVGDEENPFPVDDSGCDEVGDGLGFSGPRGTLNDEVVARTDLLDGECLGGIGIDHMVELFDRDEFVEIGVVGKTA